VTGVGALVTDPDGGAQAARRGDRIELRGLRAVGTHGVLPEERDRPQPFEVDLDVALDLRAASASDGLDDTIDYGALAVRAASVVTDERHALLERLAQRIADTVLEDPRVRGVTVTVRKLRPPVPVDLATAAVRLVRP
jgi:dihydroneopterin aldolase